MKIFRNIFLIIIYLSFILGCEPESGPYGSFFDIPKYPENYLPEIPNEPGFYVNGVNRGILLFTDIVDWINRNATNGAIYGIVLHQDIVINPVTFSFPGKNIYIILKGNTEGRSIGLARRGALFTVGNGVTFGLSDNIELRGMSDNSHSVIVIENNGKLIMNGGIISGNTTTGGGGGVNVQGSSSVFIMNEGKIMNNTVLSSYSGGGGVSVRGKFIMNGGEISNNVVNRNNSGGGGVYASGRQDLFFIPGSFTMTGGTIVNNHTNGSGGGVHISGASFTMTGGEIGNNNANSHGGGIHGNTTLTFIIEGGTIFGNNAARNGGGINFGSRGVFLKKSTGGIIYGNNAELGLQNIAGENGHAVFISNSKYRNSTVTEYVELYTNKLAEWD